MNRRPARRRQAGFAYIAAIVFLVVLAGFALAVLRLTGGEQATVNQDVLGMRAGQAARAGLEWAYYQLKNTTGTDSGTAVGSAGQVCAAINTKSTLTDFVADTGFKVTLVCDVKTFNEGLQADGSNRQKNIFQLTATACNGSGTACPDAGSVAGADYVERQRTSSICIATTGADCY